MNTAAAVAVIPMMKPIRPTIMNITIMTNAVGKNIITMSMIVAVAKSITMNILI